MANNKTLKLAGLTGVMVILAGLLVLFLDLLRLVVDFVLTVKAGAFLVLCCVLFGLQGRGQSMGLLDAVRNNDPRAVDSFLQKGADPNAYDDDSDNVLINSAIYGAVDCMRLLLQHKADPNLPNRYGHTALMLCTDNLDKIKLLLQYGANINAAAKSGSTPLLLACSGYGQYEIVKWLIDHGADITAKRWNTENALIRAAQFGDTTTVSLLVSKGFAIDSTAWGYTPLINAVGTGNWPVVFWLLDHGADVNIADPNNRLPVLFAALAGNAEVVYALLAHTNDINIPDKMFGMTPLMWATQDEYDNPGIIQAFLKKGARVNLKAKDGSTALYWAQKKGNTATVALLKKAGAK
jgi:ankyrin repeat protein